jgi:SPP1 gp7 family putative phage head morphogenesis protein
VTSRQLLAKLDRLTPSLRAEVRKALDALRRRIDVEAVIEAVVRGDELTLRRLLARLPATLTGASDVLRRAALAGAQQAGGFVTMRPAAAAIAERSAAQLVRGITKDTRETIRKTVSESFAKGISPRDTATRIRAVIGLTPRQAGAVSKLHQSLAAKDVPAKTIATRVDRYAAKLLKQRAEMIARTEIIAASTKGQIETWEDAKRRGVLADDLQKTWITTPDDKLCPICAPMDGVKVEVSEQFRVDGESLDGPPAHPNCRCSLGLSSARKSARRAA